MARRPELVFQDNALLDTARQTPLLDQIKAAGGTGIQQDVIWGDVRKNGAYDPARMQALAGLFQAANQRGLRPQVRLIGTPHYMAKGRPGVDTGLSTYTPNATVMRQFAHDMSKAFGGQVSRYAIWNEPNISSFIMRDNPADAARVYRDLYRAGYAGVKEGNRNARVGFGELTSGDPHATGAASTVGFLNRVLAGKHPLRADYVAVHPYQWSDPSRHPQGMDPGFGGISNLGAVNDAIGAAYRSGRLRTSGGNRVPLMLSEFGYRHDVANRSQRAAWLLRAMREAREQGVMGVNLYQLVPSKHGDVWDSSILTPRGALPSDFRRAIRAART